MAQKALNIYVKYMTCWAYAGQYVGGAFGALADPIGMRKFVCAAHCPLDRILINKIAKTPIGQYLEDCELLRDGEIKQEDGNWRPWSKLDCLQGYYFLQLFIRRIAMSTWPTSCACNNLSLDWSQIKNAFPSDITPEENGTWGRALNECPNSLYEKSAQIILKSQNEDEKHSLPQGNPPTHNLKTSENSKGVNLNPNRKSLKEKMCIVHVNNTYWGLRHACSSERNSWGSLSKGIYPTLAIKDITRNAMGLPLLLAAPWDQIDPLPQGGKDIHWGWRQFHHGNGMTGTANALSTLSNFFDICACDEEIQHELEERGVFFVPVCPD